VFGYFVMQLEKQYRRYAAFPTGLVDVPGTFSGVSSSYQLVKMSFHNHDKGT
jgi:hypothetical protein